MKKLLVSFLLLSGFAISHSYACQGHYYKCESSHDKVMEDFIANCENGGHIKIDWIEGC